MVVLPFFTIEKGEATSFINICRLYLRLNMEGAYEEDKVVWVLCYKLKTLEWVNEKNLVLGLTQENSIENSVQNCLPYILKPNCPCSTTLAYPK